MGKNINLQFIEQIEHMANKQDKMVNLISNHNDAN